MSKNKAFRLAAIAAVIASPLTSALATNGYFSHGYGMKAKGMGGASVAMTDNAFAGANNPAAAAWAGNRVEAGLDLFMPDRSMTRSGLGSTKSDNDLFYLPEFGYNRAINNRLGVGITLYGNGGMNTDYAAGRIPAGGCGPGAPASNLFCGSGPLGVDLAQLVIAPTVAYKVTDQHALGISPLFVVQRFKAEGLSAFGLNNKGSDTSNGVGVRLGYLGQLNKQLSIAASYSPKTSMSKLTKYAGLFAEGGGFDIPENYTLGLNFQATSNLSVAFDYAHINYGDVKSVANPSTGLGGPFGAANGPGFGWASIDVWKMGAQWQATPSLKLRAGVNIGGNPIKSADASLNTLAPGVIKMHYTLGGTYALAKDIDVTATYMKAPANSVTGFNQGGGTDTIKMSQQSLGVQFGWRW